MSFVLMANNSDFDTGYEAFESQLVATLVRPGAAALDLGAHSGHYTAILSGAVGAAGRVVAVEPDPGVLTFLCRKVWSLGLRNVDILCAAVGRPGIGRLYLDGGTGGDNRLVQRPDESRASLAVACFSVDDVVRALVPGGKVGFIKMDLQGMEAEALRGAGKTLKDNPDLMMLVELGTKELKSSGSSGNGLIQALREAGFVVLAADPGCRKLIPVNGMDPSAEGGDLTVNLLCLRGSYQDLPRPVTEMVDS